MKFPNFKNELRKLSEGYTFVAGCDEVGVGPVAGPVVAAACILDPKSISGYRSKKKWYYRVRDSKTTYDHERESLVEEIKKHCVAYGIAEVAPATIDRINIHNAAMQAMKLAVQEVLRKVGETNIFLFLDGRFRIKDLDFVAQEAVIDGDASHLTISAASIIAKVHRDKLLQNLDAQFPDYGFAQHKGYNTKAHRQAIIKHGITAFHRKSFLKKLAV